MNQPMSAPPPPPHQAPAKNSSGCLKWGLIGCVGLTVLGTIGIVLIVVVAFGALKNSEVYQMALQQAQQSQSLIEAIGEPIEDGWWLTGEINTSGPGGNANVSFPVSGPNGSATIFFEGTRQAGEWSLSMLQAELEDGTRLDLLDSEDETLQVVLDFLTAASGGDYATAHSYFSAPLREVQPFEQFSQMAAANQNLFQIDHTELDLVDGEQGPRWEGAVIHNDGESIPASFELVREGQAWRLISYQLGSGG